jgi:predicted Zn-dependent peptidase
MSTARPDVGPTAPWSIEPPRELLLDNGIRVLHHNMPGQYVLSVRIVVPLRLADEPRHVEGIASVMARLLDEGTSRIDAEGFAEELERKGVAVGAGATDGSVAVDFDVAKRNLPEALALVTEMLADPVFPEGELRRIVDSRLAEIEQERASAPHRAARELIATLYDPADRASRPTGGTADTVAAITRDDVVEFHRRHVGPDGASLAIAGDLSGIDVESVLAESVGQWANADHRTADTAVPPLPAADRARIVLVDRPGSVQSEFAVACPGPDRHVDGGWAPYPVLAFVVGGSPNARLDKVLREDKGYTYGIRSAFRPRRAGGMFVTSGSVRSEVTADALELLLGILDGARDGFTAEERGSGVDFIAQTAPARFATADAVADEYVMLALDELPLTHTNDQLEGVRALSVADLDAAWNGHVTGEWTVVVVGDAAAVREGIDGLGRGPVTVVPN